MALTRLLANQAGQGVVTRANGPGNEEQRLGLAWGRSKRGLKQLTVACGPWEPTAPSDARGRFNQTPGILPRLLAKPGKSLFCVANQSAEASGSVKRHLLTQVVLEWDAQVPPCVNCLFSRDAPCRHFNRLGFVFWLLRAGAVMKSEPH